MPLIQMTRELAYAASLDEANRAMRAGGRKAWNEDDYAVAIKEFNRHWPLCEHKIDPGECWICDEKLLFGESSEPHRAK